MPFQHTVIGHDVYLQDLRTRTEM